MTGLPLKTSILLKFKSHTFVGSKKKYDELMKKINKLKENDSNKKAVSLSSR